MDCILDFEMEILVNGRALPYLGLRAEGLFIPLEKLSDCQSFATSNGTASGHSHAYQPGSVAVGVEVERGRIRKVRALTVTNFSNRPSTSATI